MKSIIERDAFCGPSLSNPGGALGDDALAPQNGGDPYHRPAAAPALNVSAEAIDRLRSNISRMDRPVPAPPATAEREPQEDDTPLSPRSPLPWSA